MAQQTGICKYKLDGVKQKSLPGGKINIGGITRTPSVGTEVYGYTEKVTPSEVTFDVAHGVGDDLTQYNQLTKSTLEFICDTGQTYLIVGAWLAEPPTLTEPEKASLKFNGPPATLMKV